MATYKNNLFITKESFSFDQDYEESNRNVIFELELVTGNKNNKELFEFYDDLLNFIESYELKQSKQRDFEFEDK